MTVVTPCEALVRLDRKLSRALFTGKGIKLAAEDLELLTSLGMMEQVAESKALALKEEARCRQLRVVSTNEGNSGSISSVERMASRPAIDGTSGGMTPPQGASSGKARARRMFGGHATS